MQQPGQQQEVTNLEEGERMEVDREENIVQVRIF